MNKVQKYSLIILFSIIGLMVIIGIITENTDKEVPKGKYHELNYYLSLAEDNKSDFLTVEFEIRGKLSDNLVINLPHQWANAYYADQIKNIKIWPQYEFELNKDENQLIIKIPEPIGKIKLEYNVHQKKGNPSNVHQAIIRKDLIHAPGYGILAVPDDLKDSDEFKSKINWCMIPNSWKFVSSNNAKRLTFIPNMKAQDLLHSLYVAGDIRWHQVGSKENPVFILLYGEFDMTDQEIISDIQKTIQSQREFFVDFNVPHYAVSIIEGDDPCSMGGTGLRNSFTAFLPKGMKPIEYHNLLAHELLHNWIGGKIRNNEDEQLNYWWSEGFTEYYSRLISARSGGISFEEFITEINDFLRKYQFSPVISEPNSRIKDDFWKNHNIEKLPYYRGFAFAIYLNDMIKKSNPDLSLDLILHELLKHSDKKKFSIDLFKEIVNQHVNIDLAISQFIEKGNVIPLNNLDLPIEKTLVGKYHRGFDYEAFVVDKIIKDMDEKSNAYKAGIRNNQDVLEYDFLAGRDANQIVTIRTSEGVFKFRPENYNKVEIYQIKEHLSDTEINRLKTFFNL
jgi:predicted metalloprotease with PDZ domain